MGRFKIPLSYNAIAPEKLSHILNVYNNRHHNEIISDFEDQIRAKTGVRHALALNSGTAAIHLALRLLDVGPGDEVLVSTFTYIASANPVLYLGAIPVFIDSESDSWNMDPVILENVINERMRKGKKPAAILVVHCYGMPARMEEIIAIAERNKIPVIEDAAEALGSTINGKHVGSFGTIGILSFNNNKIATTYGGGALLTNDGTFHKKAQFWASQSREDFLYYLHKETGYNYRMSPLNAAYGLSQLPDLDAKIGLRRDAHLTYKQGLAEHPVHFPEERDGYFSNRWIITALLSDAKTQEHVSATLLSEGIEVRPLWNPMHKQPLFENHPSYTNGISEKLFARGICLPSNSTASELDLVLSRLKSCLR